MRNSRRKWTNGFPVVLFGCLIAIFAIALFYRTVRWPAPHRSGETGRRPRSPDFPIPNTRSRPSSESACESVGVSCSSTYIADWHEPAEQSCQTRASHGLPIPDPACTPGGTNSTVGIAVLKDPNWRTGCVRNCDTSEQQKHIVYAWYGMAKPRSNSGRNQTCELDHLIPLELGGADGLGNIWPECGPDEAPLRARYFKQKDRVEAFLAHQVRMGTIPLRDAQLRIAQDWTQFISDADEYCRTTGKCD